MAHAASSRSDNILKQGYLKRSTSSPDFLMSASKQLCVNLKQKFEPHRWFVFGTRNRHPYLEYYDREERVFTGRPTDTIDLSTFRNLSYTLGRTNNKHSFCLFLSNRVVELTAPNRAQMLEWCRCLERNLRQLGFKNQAQREDHAYSEFPVKNYKPKRSASPSEDLLTTGHQASEAAENLYEDVNDNTSAKTSAAEAGVPSLPPRPPKAHVEQEEEVFASLESVTRSSNSNEGIYYMFDYSDEDQRLMEAHVTVNEIQDAIEVDNSDLAEYDDADGVLLACHAQKEKDHDQFDNENDEAGERCSSLPIIPPKPVESDTSEDSDFVSTSFWLRNRKDDQNLISLDDSVSGTIKGPLNRQLPPIPKSNETTPPLLPRRIESGKDFRSRHCVSMYADVKHKPKTLTDKTVNTQIANNEPPPLPKRLEPEELKHLEEIDKQRLKDKKSFHEKEDVKISLGKRFDSQHVCLDPVATNDETDDGTYESVRAPKQELNNNVTKIMENNAVENAIYGQVWGTDSAVSTNSSPKIKSTRETPTSQKAHLKGSVPDKLTVALPTDGTQATCLTSNSSDNLDGVNGNFYSDFPMNESDKLGAFGFDSEFNKATTSDLYKSPNSNPMSKSTGQLSPALPKRKLHTKSNSSSDLDQIYSEVHDYPTLVVGENNCEKLLDYSNETPIAPPRRNRKTVAGMGHTNEISKQRNAKSDPEVKAGLHSPPLPVRSHTVSDRKMSEDMITSGLNESDLQSPLLPTRPRDKSGRKMSEDVIDIPLPLPPRKGAVRTKSVDDSKETGPARPRSHISVRQKSVPQLGVVTVMNLKQTQVDILRSEIASAGGMVRTISTEHFKNGLALVECYDKIWIAGWDVKKYPRLYDKFHIGDQVLSVNDVEVADLSFTSKILKHIKADYVELTIRRLPNASVFAIQRSMEGESLGIKREGGTGEIVYIDPHGLAYRHGLRNKAASMDSNTVCNWYLTEINNRPLNLFFKDNEIQHRLLAVGKDISIVVQPSDFIQELKKQLKKLRGYKDYLVQ